MSFLFQRGGPVSFPGYHWLPSISSRWVGAVVPPACNAWSAAIAARLPGDGMTGSVGSSQDGRKWLITMVVRKSPIPGVLGPLTKWPYKLLVNGGDPNHLRYLG